ncbi:AcvB/VirJ family lysyl-phosphatidylglycerol hydrolase [Niabella aquatica]
MKLLLISILLLVITKSVPAQDNTIKIYPGADHQKPLICYFSGDGGFNAFSNTICDDLSKNGYLVIALNSKSYFWKKKTPQQTAAFIEPYIQKYLKEQKQPSVVLMGYSFGADVMPFVYNSLPKTVQKVTNKILLLAPSPTTDFEVHMLDMAGGVGVYNMDVASEINKIQDAEVYLINSTKSDFPVNKVKIKNAYTTVIKGNFHFDKDPKAVLSSVYRSLN